MRRTHRRQPSTPRLLVRATKLFFFVRSRSTEKKMESRDAVGYNKEMNIMLESKVKVQLKNKENFFVIGTLKGFSRTDSVFLVNADDALRILANKKEYLFHGVENVTWLVSKCDNQS
jgi:hypothetical protein